VSGRETRRKWRQHNRDKLNARQRAKRLENLDASRAAARARYAKDGGKMRAYQLARYRKNKVARLKQMKIYWLAHRKEINEMQRRRRCEQLEIPYVPKKFSFMRDTIQEMQRLPFLQVEPIWKYIAGLPLTKKQRELVMMALDGKSQKEMAILRGVLQNTIAKSWNGNHVYHQGGVSIAGGIYKKFLKYLTFTLRDYMTNLGLKYEE